MREFRLFLVIAVVVLGACTSGTGDAARESAVPVSPTIDVTTTSMAMTPAVADAGTMSTSTTMSTTAAPPLTYPLSETVAFLDACVTDATLAGQCHCSLGALAESGIADVMADFEVAVESSDTLPAEVDDAIERCAGERLAPTAIGDLEALSAACTLGSSRLGSACQCAAERAALIVPSWALAEYVDADIEPSLVDLLNRCLGL